MSPKMKFIQPILDAIAGLAEHNGSSAKDILNYLWKSDKRTVKRNLTLQVRKALKQAVVQGFIRLRGGRYNAPRLSKGKFEIEKSQESEKSEKNEKNYEKNEKNDKKEKKEKREKKEKKDKNEKHSSVRLFEKLTRPNNIDSNNITKKLIKGSQSDSKRHATQKPKKSKKKSKPPAK